ncbi:unnamed protein product, partial [Meganyctiphanes norvegica]
SLGVESVLVTKNYSNMDLFPSILVTLGILTLATAQQPKQNFTSNGKLCVAYGEKPAECGQHGGLSTYFYIWCYTSKQGDSDLCSEDHAHEVRCSNNGVTRHGDCNITSDRYCCSPYGYCGNTTDYCECPKCLNLRDEACKQTNCGKYGDCGWDSSQNKTTCHCQQNYHNDQSTGQCVECLQDNHCTDDKHCKDKYCVDPCLNYCDSHATCNVTNHQPFCICPDGFTLERQNSQNVCKSAESGIYIMIASVVITLVILLIVIVIIIVVVIKRRRSNNRKMQENGRMAADSGHDGGHTQALTVQDINLIPTPAAVQRPVDEDNYEDVTSSCRANLAEDLYLNPKALVQNPYGNVNSNGQATLAQDVYANCAPAGQKATVENIYGNCTPAGQKATVEKLYGNSNFFRDDEIMYE